MIQVRVPVSGTYSGIRIRGAIWMRSAQRLDATFGASQGTHGCQRNAETRNEQGRDARDVEVAGGAWHVTARVPQDTQDTGIRLPHIQSGGSPGSGEYLRIAATAQSAAHSKVCSRTHSSALAEAISGLPERGRMVIALY